MKVLSSRCEAEVWRKCEVVLKRAAKEACSATCTLSTNLTFALKVRKTKENIQTMKEREREAGGGGTCNKRHYTYYNWEEGNPESLLL